MKQRIFLAFVLVFILLICGCGKKRSGSKKSESDGGYKNTKGEFEIRNVDQLIWIADKINGSETGRFPNDEDTVVKLMNDINLAGVAFNGMATAENIVFNGTFDGGGFVISNMDINTPVNDYAGFIGKTSSTAVIKNLTLKDAKVVGGQYSAIFVGQNIGKIERCASVGGNVEGTSSVGGIAGKNENGGTIEECYNTSTVKSSGGQYAGGIVGDIVGRAVVKNSYNIGDVQASGTSARAGGIAGKNDGSVEKCYNLNGKAGNKVVGDAATVPPGSTTVSTEYENVTVLVGKGWDLTNVWGMIVLSDDSNRPVLRNNMENGIPAKGENEGGYKNLQGEFEVRNAGQLTWIADQVNNSKTKFPNNDKTVVKLMNDINLAGKPFSGIAVGGSVTFNATFDGGGFLIENMNINTLGNDYVGFIGKTSSTAVVSNLRFKNASVIGNNYVGIVVGNNSGTIERCGTGSGEYNRRVEGKDYVGAIAGNNNGEIKECYNTATVYNDLSNTRYSKVGGIVGFNDSNGLVENAYNLGEVETSYAGAPPTPNVGGIAGGNLSSAVVSKCYSLKEAEFAQVDFAQLIGTCGSPGERNAAVNSPANLGEIKKDTLEQTYNWDFTDVWEMRSGQVSLKHVK